jgi:hypothetical protein
LLLDPGGDMQRLHGRERRHTGARAPGEELARRVCGLRIAEAKNSRKRTPARSPAAVTSEGSDAAAGRASSDGCIAGLRNVVMIGRLADQGPQRVFLDAQSRPQCVALEPRERCG